MRNIELSANGLNYSGWSGVSVIRSIETIAGAYDLECTENVDGKAVNWPIRPDDAVKIRIYGQDLIDGFVDSATLGIDAASHTIRVSGRDKTGDLVDCAAINKPGQWRNITIENLCAALCAPFGIEVVLEAVTSPAIPVFKVEPGETVFKAIDRACRLVGVLPIQARGALVLTHVGKSKAVDALVYGHNILAGDADFDHSDRFSDYTITGQQAGSDKVSAKQAAHVTASVRDDGVKRHRPYLKAANGQVTIIQAQRQAEWERQVRVARSMTMSVMVAGWRQSNGALWDINLLVAVDAPTLGANGDELLISAVEYTYDDGGEVTRMDLRRPDSFLPDPDDERKAQDKEAKEEAKGKKKSQMRRAGKRGKKGSHDSATAGAWELKPEADGSYKPRG